MDGSRHNLTDEVNPTENIKATSFLSFLGVSFDSSDNCVLLGIPTEVKNLVQDHWGMNFQGKRTRT